MSLLRLITSQNESVEVPLDVCKLWTPIKNLLDDVDQEDIHDIPLLGVDADVVRWVCKAYQQFPEKMNKGGFYGDTIPDDVLTFFITTTTQDIDEDTEHVGIFRALNQLNFLGGGYLFDVGTLHMGNMIDEICKTHKAECATMIDSRFKLHQYQ